MSIRGLNQGENPDIIIVGLGNPGKEYENTRRNIGFKVMDYLNSEATDARGFKKELYSSLVDKCVLGFYVVYMLKPQMYIGNSGYAVRDILSRYIYTSRKVIVIHDDSNMPVGHFKLEKDAEDCDHIGIKSIKEYLNTNKIMHIRVGIGKVPKNCNTNDFVLSSFSEDEEKLINQRFPLIKETILHVLKYDVDTAMKVFNPIGRNNKKRLLWKVF